MSGFVLLQMYDDGRLLKNFKLLTGETTKVIDSARKNIREKKADGLEWDKIRERVDRIESMARSKDSRAGYYIDVLKTDLEMLRDYTSEKGGDALAKTVQKLDAAREKLSENLPAAADKLHELSKELAPKAKPADDQATAAEKPAEKSAKSDKPVKSSTEPTPAEQAAPAKTKDK